MSNLFAFNVATPVTPEALSERGSYDPHTQLWTGQEQAMAYYCTQRCGYSGYLDCTAYSTSCRVSNYTSTGNTYMCIYIKCD